SWWGRPRRQPRGRGHHCHARAAGRVGGRRGGRLRDRRAPWQCGHRTVSVAPRVLIVEDEAGLRLTLTDRLGSEGYTVETASDGEAGLARATSGGYDLIVLDVMLPRMNGFDVCRQVRQRGVTTPILMLTARGQVVDKVVGLKLGADDYLTQPFETIELMARPEAPRRGPAPEARGQSEVARVHRHRPRSRLQVRRITTETQRRRDSKIMRAARACETRRNAKRSTEEGLRFFAFRPPACRPAKPADVR